MTDCEVVSDLERRLRGLMDNPLLFVMALGLANRGIHVQTRAGLFGAFTAGLEGRLEGEPLSEPARFGVEGCSFALRDDGRYSAPRWWWLERLGAEREGLVGRGVLSASTASAEEMLANLQSSGLVRAVGDGTELGLLHDLFCDWLASESILKDRAFLAAPVSDAFETVVAFLAEQSALKADDLLAVAGNPVAAAAVADNAPAEAVDQDLLQRLWGILGGHLAPLQRAHTEDWRPRFDPSTRLIWLEREREGDAPGDPRLSPLIALAVPPVTAISAAVDLWLASVRLGIDETRPERPTPPALGRSALVEAIETAVEERRVAFDGLINGLIPQLGDRGRDAAGPRGLVGWVLPAVDSPGFPGTTQVITEHPFVYLGVSEGAHVEVADDRPDVSRLTTTTAEAYLRSSPQAAARKTLVAAVIALIPRFDD